MKSWANLSFEKIKTIVDSFVGNYILNKDVVDGFVSDIEKWEFSKFDLLVETIHLVNKIDLYDDHGEVIFDVRSAGDLLLAFYDFYQTKFEADESGEDPSEDMINMLDYSISICERDHR